jgi:hypothetical protein
VCAGEWAWVTNQNPAPYCAIIDCRDPYGAATRFAMSLTAVASSILAMFSTRW